MDNNEFVISTINYTEDNGIPPDYYFYEPDPSIELNQPGIDMHSGDFN